MENYSLKRKTKVLNALRTVFKIRIAEDLLVWLIRRNVAAGIVKKMVPNPYQYKAGTIREATINGLRYKVDISDYLQHSLYYELDTEPYDPLLNLVKPGYHILDIGTNFGYTILQMAARAGADGWVYGFEPVPFLYNKACENVKLNSAENIRIFNNAVSSVKSVLYFDDTFSHNSGGIHMSFTPKQHRVEAIRLDDFIERERIEKIDLIKADIEGFEMEMLKGAKQLLEKFHPVLFLELNNNFLSRAGSSIKEVLQFLYLLNYKVCDTDTGKELNMNGDFSNLHLDVIARYLTDDHIG